MMKAQTCTLRPMAGFRWVAIALASLVLGLWGVYDYAFKIPAQAAMHERFQIAKHVAAALEEPDFTTQSFQDKSRNALSRIDAQLARMGREPGPIGERSQVTAMMDQLRSDLQHADAGHLDAWLRTLAVYRAGLENPTRLGQPLSGWAALAWELTQPVINAFGSVTPPATFDRLVQWAFISCLPFFPWYMIVFFRARAKKYTLSEDGELSLPGNQTWPLDLIAGIDMSKWMSKSIATVNHTSGRSQVLDDHIYQDLHIIIGQLAHHFEPDKWTQEARVVKPDSDE